MVSMYFESLLASWAALRYTTILTQLPIRRTSYAGQNIYHLDPCPWEFWGSLLSHQYHSSQCRGLSVVIMSCWQRGSFKGTHFSVTELPLSSCTHITCWFLVRRSDQPPGNDVAVSTDNGTLSSPAIVSLYYRGVKTLTLRTVFYSLYCSRLWPLNLDITVHFHWTSAHWQSIYYV